MDYGKWLKREMDRISERGERTKNIAALMHRLRRSLNHYYPYERGEVPLTSEQIEICAEFFGVESPLKRKAHERHDNGVASRANVVPLRSAIPAPISEFTRYPILGVVDAGAFREADSLSQVEQRDIDGPINDIYPNATRMAWESRGDSMNEAGILDGTILLGVDFQESGGILTNGMTVVVQQDRGGLIERSVKAVAVYPDRIEFQPRSSNPIHKPIIYRNGEADNDNLIEVTVLTVVHCILKML